VIGNDTNLRLTTVGPTTPMGALLRRYWHPIAAVSELDDNPVKAIRIMGEDLVLYRDLSGNMGLIDRHCPHRSADLSYGFVEKCGLRCSYHGWLFNESGRCLAQPYEDIAAPNARSKDHLKTKAYKVEAKAGLIWAYMGPDPAPLLPTWEPFTWKNGFVQVVFSKIPCNWFQCQENSIDPVHFEWMHDNWKLRLNQGAEHSGYSPAHTEVGFDEFEWGFVYRRVRTGSTRDDEYWRIGRICLWPNALFTGTHFEWRVPIDDENTLSVTWAYSHVPKEREPFVQNEIPFWYGSIIDEKTGRYITSHVMNQDFVAWMGQGVITNRGREHLGRSDAGVVMMRRRMIEQMDIVAAGGEPKGLLRDPERNEMIELPIIWRKWLRDGMSEQDKRDHPHVARFVLPKAYPLQAGQPEDVMRQYEDAMGIKL
jgi:5,5'-dehydrodivanillate O-demethylase